MKRVGRFGRYTPPQPSREALEAENAELKRDADRWRFYREGYSNPAEAEANVDAAMEAATQPSDKP